MEALVKFLKRNPVVDWDEFKTDLERQREERLRIANLHRKLEWELEMIKSRKDVRE